MAKIEPLKQPVIRDATAADLETLVKTLSDSFCEDPMMNWVIPPTALYPAYFRLLIREVYLPRGIIHTEQDTRAAALWLPPEERLQVAPRMPLLSLGLRLLRLGGVRAFLRLGKQNVIFEKYLPSEPHYYLQFIGCRPEDQGNGLGSALLQQGTAVCDDHGMPAYLESSNQLNVPLYQRHGFEVIAEEALGHLGPTVWFMWRDAR